MKPARLVRAASAAIDALENRCLFAALVPSSPVLVFSDDASTAGPSHTDTLTITNTGATALSLGGVSVVADPAGTAGDQSADFQVTSGSLTGSLAAGASRNITVNFTASFANTVESALLRVGSNDPASPLTVQLHGLGTNGQFGTSEPSLANILTAFDIPTNIGATNPSDSQYPLSPDPSTEEVPLQRLVKAGSGPVMIQMLAAFNAAAAPSARFGYYTPGTPSNATELFTINNADDQTVNPVAQGATAFDPGSATFGLYANFPGIGATDTHYSESTLNVPLDSANPTKFRFFPLKNADGSVVPNAYVVAAEDYNGTAYHSFTNVVAIIRNVQAAPNATNAPVMGLTNLNAVPGTNVMVFNRIQNSNPNLPDPPNFHDIVHDTNTLRIMNTGDQPLQITGLTLSDPTAWQIVSPPSLPATVAPGASLDVTIQFIASSNSAHTDNQTNDTVTGNGVDPVQAGGVWTGTLNITSNDPANPSGVIPLAGYWQDMSENENEPGLPTVVNSIFGYTSQIGASVRQQYPNFDNRGSQTQPLYYGEELQPGSDLNYDGYWDQVDSSVPVSVRQLTSFHQQWSTDSNGNSVQTTSTFYWAPKSNPTGYTALFSVEPGAGQSLVPPINGSTTTPAAAQFNPSGTFAWNLDGESSVDSQNTIDINTFGRSGHGVRIYQARDAQGNQIPDTWLLVMDYEDSSFDNSDFQDNIYIVSNVRPDVDPPSATDVQAIAQSSGGVALQWAPVNYGTLGGYNILRAATPTGPWTQLNSGPVTGTSYSDNTAPSGTLLYYGVCSVDISGHHKSRGMTVHVQTAGASTDVLTSQDINATPAGATAIITAGKNYDLTGGGVDIGGTDSDGFRYAYESVTGDFDVSVQVASVTQSVATNAKAGLMARASLDAGSQMVFSGVTPGSGYRFNYRTVANTVGTFNSIGSISYPNAWVRLTRVGDVFTAYSSTDGTNWAQTGTLTLSLPSTIDLGLAADSHSTTQTLTAQFRNFNLVNASSTLPAPTGLTAGGASTGITLQWAAVSGAAGYSVYRSASASGPFTLLGSVPVTGTSYSDTDAPTGSMSYYEVVALDSSGHTSSPATTSATRPSSSNPLTFGGRTTVTYTDDAGHKVALRLTGPGSGVAIFNDGALTPDSIDLTGTTAASTLTITVTGGTTHVGSIVVDGSLGRLAAPKTLLQGDLAVGGSLNSVQLAGASGGHTLSVGAAGRIATLNVGQVSDLSIRSASAIAQLQATTWANTNGTDLIVAPSITRLVVPQGFGASLNLTGAGIELGSATLRGGVTGGPWTLAASAGQIVVGPVDPAWAGTFGGSVASFNTTGDFAGTLTAEVIGNVHVGGSLTGTIHLTGGTARDLRALTVGGAIDGGQIRALGSIGSITAAGLINANVFAGVADSITALPALASDFVQSSAIMSVVVTGRRLPFAVENSNVAAQTLGRINFGAVNTDNGGVPFGLAAHSLTRYARKIDGKVLVWTSRLSPSLLTNSGDAQARLI
jgi:regulation of enolase protein 1 (concanavalin A-like superfamily)